MRMEPGMTHSLMYSSAAAFALDDREVAALLADSRRRNAENGVTGMLVYIRVDDERCAFLQVLEGPEASVEQTYARIAGDELHTDLTVLSRGPVAQRRFAGWSMRFAALPGDDLLDASGRGDADPFQLLRDGAAMERVLAALGAE
ncbi:Sensors of blue-light using FAD [Pseudonocardia oroxyli]|uniref:Sensors of blue-light using FAD n=2 Tax=Pseudonocardia oroxyli TaxID=366584 RepID=A0A1G7PWL5_PSEOR|nr:Sensors of blue-light using FAD [Pseudonocardia oroxyli]